MADPSSSPPSLSTKLGARAGAGVTLFFTTSRADLVRRFPKLCRTIAPAEGLWIAWPKKTAAVESDLDFAAVQRIGLDAGLVDNKSCAIDEHWQALRFVVRRADR